MSIGTNIAKFRRNAGLTQEALAQRLEVTNQAVSKWESDQCCPDITLLPRLADIFETTIDALFDRQVSTTTEAPDVPWKDDDILHVAVFHGRTYIGKSDGCGDMTFQYEGPALNIDCAVSIQCGEVSGNVSAGGSVNCEDVYGSVYAGGSVDSNQVYGSVQAGGNVTCDDVDGDVRAGGSITCDTVDGDADAGGNITCDEICGNASAKGDIFCDNFRVDSAAERAERKNDTDRTVRVQKTVRTGDNGRTITYTFTKE